MKGKKKNDFHKKWAGGWMKKFWKILTLGERQNAEIFANFCYLYQNFARLSYRDQWPAKQLIINLKSLFSAFHFMMLLFESKYLISICSKFIDD